MRPVERLLRNLTTLALAATFVVAPVRARAENGANDLPPPADTRPIYPPPPVQPDDSDRNKGNGAAIAAAIIGAAMAGASCAMLMKQAQEARAAGDTQQANQLMMQAMQQCAQAAANAANAAQNQDNGKKINQSDPGTPKWADLPQGEATKKAESKTAQSLPASSEEKPEEETVDPAEFKGLDERAFANAPGTEPGTGGDNMGGSIGGGIVKLDPIDSTSVQFDDKSKGGGTTPQTPLGSSSSVVAGGGVGANGGPQFQDGRIDDGAPDGKAPNARSSRITGNGPSSGGGGSSSEHSSSGGGFDMASLMEKLNGGAKGDGGGSIPADIQAFKKTVDGTNVSIFQYASFRYRKAQRDDGLILDVRKKLAAGDTGLTATPARAPASKPPPAPPAKPGKGIGEQKPLKKPTVVSRR